MEIWSQRRQRRLLLRLAYGRDSRQVGAVGQRIRPLHSRQQLSRGRRSLTGVAPCGHQLRGNVVAD